MWFILIQQMFWFHLSTWSSLSAMISTIPGLPFLHFRCPSAISSVHAITRQISGPILNGRWNIFKVCLLLNKLCWLSVFPLYVAFFSIFLLVRLLAIVQKIIKHQVSVNHHCFQGEWQVGNIHYITKSKRCTSFIVSFSYIFCFLWTGFGLVVYPRHVYYFVSSHYL